MISGRVLEKEKRVPGREDLRKKYQLVRQRTEDICRSLETEDYVIQSMEDVSPPKWHLGHTSWFFETFLLQRFDPQYRVYHELYGFLYNSYYESVGSRVARPTRGLLSRPTVKEVYTYRAHIDEQMLLLLDRCKESDWAEIRFLVDLGIHHEQQHQELLVTDIKHILSINPLKPVYRKPDQVQEVSRDIPPARFIDFEGGNFEIGYAGDGFSFDNERPRHRVWLNDYRIQNRLVTNGEYQEFIRDGGYRDPLLWLSDGWYAVKEFGWNAPLYWQQQEDGWYEFSLRGPRKLNAAEPVCHVSYYEADAYARWARMRLPTEEEWEHAAESATEKMPQGNFVETEQFHPLPGSESIDLTQMFGDVWEWTVSAYLPYPGFRPEAGAIGEYNGKFMSNQMVLRGGSCATPRSHIRGTYRNFFQCDKRWQFSGIRLASDE